MPKFSNACLCMRKLRQRLHASVRSKDEISAENRRLLGPGKQQITNEEEHQRRSAKPSAIPEIKSPYKVHGLRALAIITANMEENERLRAELRKETIEEIVGLMVLHHGVGNTDVYDILGLIAGRQLSPAIGFDGVVDAVADAIVGYQEAVDEMIRKRKAGGKEMEQM